MCESTQPGHSSTQQINLRNEKEDIVAHACNPRTEAAETGLENCDRLDYTARAYQKQQRKLINTRNHPSSELFMLLYTTALGFLTETKQFCNSETGNDLAMHVKILPFKMLGVCGHGKDGHKIINSKMLVLSDLYCAS